MSNSLQVGAPKFRETSKGIPVNAQVASVEQIQCFVAAKSEAGACKGLQITSLDAWRLVGVGAVKGSFQANAAAGSTSARPVPALVARSQGGLTLGPEGGSSLQISADLAGKKK